MYSFSIEVSKTAHAINMLENVAVKTASAEDSFSAQLTTAIASDRLYDVIVKQATDYSPKRFNCLPVTQCVVKMAAYLGKPAPSDELCVKLAAAVAVDDALSQTLSTVTGTEAEKVAAVRAYGREYFMELLREVI